MVAPPPATRAVHQPAPTTESIRTRYNLPPGPLSLADARLAVANATLAACLGGEMVLVRSQGHPRTIAERNTHLLSWLGFEWTTADVKETMVKADLESSALALGCAAGERRHLSRLVQDHALGVTHAVIFADERGLISLSERATEMLGWLTVRYVSIGSAKTPNEGIPTRLEWYYARGYLPEALRTHLAASAIWATPPKDPDTAQMAARYRAGHLSRATWYPDLEQLQSAGHQAMQNANPERVMRLLRARLERTYGQWHQASGTSHGAEAWLAVLSNALQQEVACLGEGVNLARFAFEDRVGTMTPEASAALCGSHVPAVLAECVQRLQPEELATPDGAALFFQELRHYFRRAMELRGQQVMYPIRAALTGTLVGPCLGVVASLLGYERCSRRLHETLDSLPPRARDQS